MGPSVTGARYGATTKTPKQSGVREANSNRNAGGKKRADQRMKEGLKVTRAVWKTRTRNGIEDEILRNLDGASHHLPVVLSASVAAAFGVDSADVFGMPYYADRGCASMEEVRVLVTHVAEALAYLHSEGIVHGDVKRSNVRFSGREAVLIDLDSAAYWREGDPPLLVCAVQRTGARLRRRQARRRQASRTCGALAWFYLTNCST